MDYYEVLEIPKTATADEIKKAYRQLAKKYHPDQNQGDKAAEEKFKKINEAYTVLSDPEKRKMYDGGYYGSQYENTRSYGGANSGTYGADPFQQFWEEWARHQQAYQKRYSYHTTKSDHNKRTFRTSGPGAIIGIGVLIFGVLFLLRVGVRILFSPIGLILLVMWLINNYNRS